MSILRLFTSSAGAKHFVCDNDDIATLPTNVPRWSTSIVRDSPGLLMVFDGDDWRQQSMSAGVLEDAAFRAAVMLAHMPRHRTLYCLTQDNVVGNTAAETHIIEGGVGSLEVPDNSTQVGDTLRVKIVGFLTTPAVSPTSTLRVYYGGQLFIQSSAALPQNLSAAFCEIELLGTARAIGASGKIIAQGRSLIHTASGVATASMRALTMAAEATIDTTVPAELHFTYQWDSASASKILRVTNAVVELLRN